MKPHCSHPAAGIDAAGLAPLARVAAATLSVFLVVSTHAALAARAMLILG